MNPPAHVLMLCRDCGHEQKGTINRGDRVRVDKCPLCGSLQIDMWDDKGSRLIAQNAGGKHFQLADDGLGYEKPDPPYVAPTYKQLKQEHVVSGDRVESTLDRRQGIVSDILQDGDCYVDWEDGKGSPYKWHNLRKVLTTDA